AYNGLTASKMIGFRCIMAPYSTRNAHRHWRTTVLRNPALALKKLLDSSVQRCSSWSQENIRVHAFADVL
ncbi:hypothetical protein NG726_37385, partial [Pseudomonas sp. MOB-449]|nr:hypothetical protein [Pseudomonas sp. MOB-449]